VQHVSFSADGRWLATSVKEQYGKGGSHNWDLRMEMFVWNTANGLPVACMTDKGSPSNETMRSQGGEAVCSNLKETRHADLLSEAPHWKNSLKESKESLNSNDGRWQAERGNQGLALTFMEGNTGRQVALLMPGSAVSDAAFTPDSRWLVTAEDNLITVWPLKPADMIDAACARLRRQDLTPDERKVYSSDGKLQQTCSPKSQR